MNRISEVLISLGEYFVMIIEVILISVSRPPSGMLIRDQLYRIGVTSLPVVAITGFSTGIVLAAQSFFQLSDYGLSSATGIMVTKAMIVELGPVLTAFMVTGRVGAAMCAELGTMRVTEQIDALRSMAVNPASYLIAPRFISGVFMMPLLTVFSCFMGVVGGYIMSVDYYGMSPSAFLDPLPAHIDNFDLLSGFIKSVIFGIIIVTISCYYGITTSGGAEGVGRATTNSVVVCYSVILVANFLITVGLNSSYDFLLEWVPWLVE